MPHASTTRRYDVDWLRVFATYLLFPFHVGKVFDVPPFYHIKNAELSPSLGFLTGFIHQWHMPLFFLLAGWSAYGSLRARGAGGFLRERLGRLLLPFVAGVVLLCPVIKYVELAHGIRAGADGRLSLAAGFNESFVQFLPTFFTSLDRFTWAHLWFLIYLFTFTLLYLPVFVRLLQRPARDGHTRRAMVYLPIVPLALIQVTLRGRWPGFQNLYDDWANFSYYSLYFMLGFLLARSPEWERVVQREWRRAAAFALAALALMVVTDFVPTSPVANRALSAVAGWGCVVALLGSAARFLTFTNAPLRYLSESAFPVYILHQLGIVLVGSVVIQLSFGIATKYVLLLALSVAATMALYHFVVRPVPLLRMLFGMKAAPRVAISSGVPVVAARLS